MGAVKQAGAALVRQEADLVAYGRGGEAQFVRCLLDRAQPRRRLEGAHRFQGRRLARRLPEFISAIGSSDSLEAGR